MTKFFDKNLNDHILDPGHFDTVIWPKKKTPVVASGEPIGPTADTDLIRADTNLYTADSY